MKIVSIVGMTGSGKSEVAAVFARKGYTIIRFGDITDGEVRKMGLPLNEANEKRARESLREKHGMAAYAVLNAARIEDALEKSNVVIDGLYSWEEYRYLKAKFGDDFIVVAVYSSPGTRYRRLGHRKVRPLTPEEAAGRDLAEIENLNKGGPIAVADFTVINESSPEALEKEVERIIGELK